jgi:hypothetical protein
MKLEYKGATNSDRGNPEEITVKLSADEKAVLKGFVRLYLDQETINSDLYLATANFTMNVEPGENEVSFKPRDLLSDTWFPASAYFNLIIHLPEGGFWEQAFKRPSRQERQ